MVQSTSAGVLRPMYCCAHYFLESTGPGSAPVLDSRVLRQKVYVTIEFDKTCSRSNCSFVVVYTITQTNYLRSRMLVKSRTNALAYWMNGALKPPIHRYTSRRINLEPKQKMRVLPCKVSCHRITPQSHPWQWPRGLHCHCTGSHEGPCNGEHVAS